MRLTIVLILCVLFSGRLSADDPKLTPPPAERISALMDFSGPVSLVLRVATKEELARKPKRGVPLVAYSYMDRERTSEAIGVAIYPAGEFLKEKRAELMAWLAKHTPPSGDGVPATGGFRTADGRSIFQFPMGMGPGGSADGALLACRNGKYEIVVTQQTDYHDEEDPKAYSNHVKPRKQLREVIEAIEALVMP